MMMRHHLSIFLFVIALAHSPARGASLVPGDEVFLFGGRPGSVPVTIRNDEAEGRRQHLEWRLFQRSSATLAPIGEPVSLGPRDFPADQDSVLRIQLQPPEVRAITGFVLKLRADGTELGQVRITVCPTNLFSKLKGLGITVQEPGKLVSALLPVAEPGTETTLAIVRLPTRETSWVRDDLAPAVLYIVGSGVPGAERLMPLKISTENGRTTAILQEWFVPDLERNALSQLRLLRVIDLMSNPGQVRSPQKHK